MKTYYVYKLHAGTPDEPFYLGKGSGGRKDFHLSRSSALTHYNKKLQNKILKTLAEGKEVISEIVFETFDENEAFEKEKQLISQYGRSNLNSGPLMNLTAGGQGVDGWWKALTDEEKELSRRSQSEKLRETVTNKWAKLSLEERNAIMEKIRSGHSDEWHAKATATRKEKFAKETPEQKQARVLKHKEAAKSIDYEKRLSKYQETVSKWTDEQNAARSEACRQAAQKRWGKKNA